MNITVLLTAAITFFIHATRTRQNTHARPPTRSEVIEQTVELVVIDLLLVSVWVLAVGFHPTLTAVGGALISMIVAGAVTWTRNRAL
jgi:hypothetical protein